MYYFELFDAVMFGIVMLLLIAFAVSVTHATMKVKLEAVQSTLNQQLNWVGMEYSQVFEDLLSAQAWRDAVIELCVVNHISWDANNPEATLAFLMHVESQMALDPTISKQAAALINKAKREHGKKIRKAADRKLERTERAYEERIAAMHITISSMQQSNTYLRGELGEIRAELTAFQSIVGQELENFVRLPSVRNKMLATINQQHKAWQEL